MRRLLIGVNRKTAANFGFDDELFYEELDQPKHNRTVRQLDGIMTEEVSEVGRNTNRFSAAMADCVRYSASHRRIKGVFYVAVE